ncbi:hypothetical protein EXS61_00420 [Candidatus Parcubacteria bacterium]|nr:hypothetical protein [Candidatus Parcubacteria bacterium]
MIQRYSYKGITWLDLDHPTDKDVDDIIKEFKIDGVIANELSKPSIKPRVELYHDFIYLVLHFPAFKHSHSDKTTQEVDFIIGRDFLVTARYDTVDALHKFAKQLEVSSILDKKNIEYPTGYIFYMILKEIYSTIFDELSYIESWQKNIENKIFKGDERNMVFDLSNVSRTLLDFQKTMDAHKEVLISLEIIGKKALGNHFSLYTRVALEEYHKIQNTIKNLRDVVVELRETNNSLLDTKGNEITKVLTIMAFIAVPLSLIVSVFQIDTVARPLIGQPNDFWILIGGIFAVGVVMFSFFKFKHWL